MRVHVLNRSLSLGGRRSISGPLGVGSGFGFSGLRRGEFGLQICHRGGTGVDDTARVLASHPVEHLHLRHQTPLIVDVTERPFLARFTCDAQTMRLVLALALTAGAVGGMVAGAGGAVADGAVPHEVTYTVYTDSPFHADIYYRDAEPVSFADYSHDPYVFSPKAEADLGPGAPWVLTVRLEDPQHWAMVTATSGRSPNPPGFHCTLAVDGAVVVSNSGANGALCSLRPW